MKWNEVFCNTFKAIRSRKDYKGCEVDLMLPSMKMVNVCRSDDFDFFQPFISTGKLTAEQMQHACSRYFLGKTKSGTPMFWMIDDMMQPLDAHIGNAWISSLLKQREPVLAYWQVQHCLFGLHLLEVDYPISIVESEASAVLLSELFPDSIWMAYAMTSHLLPDLLAPLQGRTVTIYPRTDPTMSTYLFFLDYATSVHSLYPSVDLHIDTTLENHASEEQKDRCIDLVDFLLE